MKIAVNTLIDDLIEATKENLNEIERFKQLSEEVLNWKADAKSWSILECVEHLNLYGDFYLPEIEQRIKKAPATKGTNVQYKSGLLGNYFANSVAAKPEGKLNTMATFKDKNPVGSTLDKKVLERFADQQHQTLKLLNQARTVNLMKVKTSISISTWISLRLGDTFRVVIYHNQRHIVQANKVLAMQGVEA